MINLLSEDQKKELKGEETQRKVFSIILFITLSSVLFVFILFGIRSYVFSKTVKMSELVLEKDKELKSSELQESKKIIGEINEDLSQIIVVKNEKVSVDIFLERLSALIPRDIYFTTVSFTKEQREIKKNDEIEIEFFGKVNIQGIAETREALFNFRNIILKEPSFRGAYLLPPSWAQAEDAIFSLSLEFKL